MTITHDNDKKKDCKCGANLEKCSCKEKAKLFSEEQMKKAWNNGVEASDEICGNFNIEDY